MKKNSIITGIILLFLCLALLYIHKVGHGSHEPSSSKDYKIVKASGLEFQVLTMGNPSNKPVILLHGFPESAVMWKKLMTSLADKGYYCIAPNQRGYSPGARPENKSAYTFNLLKKDVIEIADSLKINKFNLIAHDWGCAVGWGVAAQYPNRVISFTALSIPHVEAFGRAYKHDKKQHKNSSYIRFFRIPLLPEFILARNNYAMLRKLYTNHSDEEISHYISLFGEYYALTAALNWYRANFSLFDKGFKVGKIAVPTLFIWGKKDMAVSESGVDKTKNYISGPYSLLKLNAGHWLIQEKFKKTEKEILKHLKRINH